MRAGYEPAYGARPLKRLLQQRIGDQLAIALLEGRYAEGDTVVVDAAEGEIVLSGGSGAGPDEVVAALAPGA